MRYLKPTSPGTRGMTRIEYRKELSGHKKEKALTRGRRRTAGRNADGRITMRHRGGGHKRLWREAICGSAATRSPLKHIYGIRISLHRSGKSSSSRKNASRNIYLQCFA